MAETSPFAQCTRFLCGHGPRYAQSGLQMALSQANADLRTDFYGGGELIESFESELAAMLGQESAVFMPSGTMAQQIALRIWSDEANCKGIAMHATSHMEMHEQGAYRELHHLQAHLLADDSRLATLADLQALTEPVAAILWELPQREIGGQLPSWETLQREVAWAKDQGIRCHLDGARLWEAAPSLGHSHAKIGGLFDSVYVSFYKGLGGIAGAVLAGPRNLVAKAKIWQRRHGGGLISLYPYILSARAGMKEHLGKFEAYRDRAQEIALRLAKIDGITVVPTVPPTLMMHLHVARSAESLNAANHKLAADTQVMLFGKASARQDKAKIELSIGAASQSLTCDEVESLFRRLVS